jgi:hypothetical protein
MYVVGHEAIGKHIDAQRSTIMRQALQVNLAVLVSEEYVLSAIAPLSNVMRYAR